MGASRFVRAHRGIASAAAVAGVMGLVTVTPAAAQRGPVFELQSGIAVNDFVSVPEGIATNTAFSLRFATRFPTGSRWLTPVVGAVLLPYGSTENTLRNTDAPTLFAGNIFRLTPNAPKTGWFSLEVPLVIAHSPGAGPTGNIRDYGRDLVVFPTVYLHLGARALRELGSFWSRLDVFGQLEQNLTPNQEPTGGRDWFNPIATLGLSITVGPSPN